MSNPNLQGRRQRSPNQGSPPVTRRRRLSSGNGNIMTPTFYSSICDNARITSVSTNSYMNGYYNLEHSRNIRHAPSLRLDSILPEVPKKRVCVCDDFLKPLSCEACSQTTSVSPCPSHKLIDCSSINCNKQYHALCISLIQGKQINNIDEDNFLCISCESRKNNTFLPFTALGPMQIEDKLSRFGLELPSTEREIRKAKRSLMKLKHTLENVCYPSHFHYILDSSPKFFPTASGMKESAKKKHAIYGRRFEISLLMYEVDKCTCCGRVQPGHIDPDFPNNTPFERQHLMNVYHEAWHCNCNGFCKGSQFYATKKKSEISLFKTKHNGKTPWEFLSLNKNHPNAVLCDYCYREINYKDTNGKYLIFQYLLCLYFS